MTSIPASPPSPITPTEDSHRHRPQASLPRSCFQRLALYHPAHQPACSLPPEGFPLQLRSSNPLLVSACWLAFVPFPHPPHPLCTSFYIPPTARSYSMPDRDLCAGPASVGDAAGGPSTGLGQARRRGLWDCEGEGGVKKYTKGAGSRGLRSGCRERRTDSEYLLRRLGCVAIPSSNGWVVRRKMGVGVWVRFGGLCSYISDGEERSGRMVTWMRRRIEVCFGLDAVDVGVLWGQDLSSRIFCLCSKLRFRVLVVVGMQKREVSS